MSDVSFICLFELSRRESWAPAFANGRIHFLLKRKVFSVASLLWTNLRVWAQDSAQYRTPWTAQQVMLRLDCCAQASRPASESHLGSSCCGYVPLCACAWSPHYGAAFTEMTLIPSRAVRRGGGGCGLSGRFDIFGLFVSYGASADRREGGVGKGRGEGGSVSRLLAQWRIPIAVSGPEGVRVTADWKKRFYINIKSFVIYIYDTASCGWKTNRSLITLIMARRRCILYMAYGLAKMINRDIFTGSNVQFFISRPGQHFF